MAITISIIISMLALLATFYQLHLQRIHNEKSLKPLGQIVLADRNKQLSVYVCNNGLGPLIIDRLTFFKSDNIYSSITDCFDLNPKSYMHVSGDDAVKRVVLPNAHLTVFEKHFRDPSNEDEMDHVRLKLSPIKLQVFCRDIYDNNITLERDFKWFSRYILESVDN